MAEPIRLSQVVGKSYDAFWDCRSFYRVCKGSRGSKKSKTSALWYIYHMMKYPDANVLVIRRVFQTLKDSCFTELMWAIDRLGVSKYWKTSLNPLQMTYIPTGQVILFRGVDDPLKITSIAVKHGYLCWVWIEEAYEITNEADFDMIMMSIRGRIPKHTGLFKQITMTFNPWSEHTWIKKRFFDDPNEDVFTLTTTYRDNEFLGPEDVARFEQMYERNPRAARVICDGDWGIAEGLIYDNWEELPLDFDMNPILRREGIKMAFGLDFGYAVSYNAFVAAAVDIKTREIWIFDEMYQQGMTNLDIARKICQMGYGKEEIWADCAEPKSIYELQQGLVEEIKGDNNTATYQKWQLPNIRPAMKGSDSVSNGIQRLQSFKIWVMPKCGNMLHELANYAWEIDRDGNYTGKPNKEWDHLCLTGDTLITTDNGSIPISKIRPGMNVLSHLGWREVTDWALTDDNADIWCIELENGIILKGTPDHPVVTSKGIKRLDSITEYDEVVVWGISNTLDVKTELNTLNMMDCCGIDTQMQIQDPTESIISDTTADSTNTFGKNIMGQFQKDAKYTTSMEIPETTTSQTLCLSHVKNTARCIPAQMISVDCGLNQSIKSKISVEHGTNQKKDTNGTFNMPAICSLQKENISVNIAENTSLRNHTEQTNSVQINADLPIEEKWGSITRCAFVKCAEKNMSQTNTRNQRPVLCHVATSYALSDKASVYSITVDEAHDYFANGILVRNCDSLRYACNKFFIRGRGHVSEVKGNDTPVPEGERYRSRRVVSTY